MAISKLIGLDVLNKKLKKVYAKITDETNIKIESNTQAIVSNTNRINENANNIADTNRNLNLAISNITNTTTSNYSELNSKIETNDATATAKSRKRDIIISGFPLFIQYGFFIILY